MDDSSSSGDSNDDQVSWNSLSDDDEDEMENSVSYFTEETEEIQSVISSTPIYFPTSPPPVMQFSQHYDDEEAGTTTITDDENELPSVSKLIYDHKSIPFETTTAVPPVELAQVKTSQTQLQEAYRHNQEREQVHQAYLNSSNEKILQLNQDLKDTRDRCSEWKDKALGAETRIQELEAAASSKNLEMELEGKTADHEYEMLRNRLLDAEQEASKLKKQLQNSIFAAEAARKEFVQQLAEKEQMLATLIAERDTAVFKHSSIQEDNIAESAKHAREQAHLIQQVKEYEKNASNVTDTSFLTREVEALRIENKQLKATSAAAISSPHVNNTTMHPPIPPFTPPQYHQSTVFKSSPTPPYSEKTEKENRNNFIAAAGPTTTMSLADLGYTKPVKPAPHSAPALPASSPNKPLDSTSVRQLLSFDDTNSTKNNSSTRKGSKELSAPYADDKNKKDKDALYRLGLENELMHLHIEKQGLEAEYQKLDQIGNKTIRSRKRRGTIEDRLVVLKKEINSLKLHLRNRAD